MAHTLPQLPYAFDALEPHIDAKTMEIHSQKHHKAYVDNLNKALESAPDLANLSIEELLRVVKTKAPDSVKQAIINNGGGHHNHALFWEIMGPNGGGEPSGHRPVGPQVQGQGLTVENPGPAHATARLPRPPPNISRSAASISSWVSGPCKSSFAAMSSSSWSRSIWRWIAAST